LYYRVPDLDSQAAHNLGWRRFVISASEKCLSSIYLYEKPSVSLPTAVFDLTSALTKTAPLYLLARI
jgi:hypothetical protein